MLLEFSELGRGIFRNLRAGTRLALFLPVDRSAFQFGALPLAAMWGLALLSFCAVQLPFSWPVSGVSPRGLSFALASFFATLAALHLGAVLISRGAQSGRLQVMALSALTLTFLLVLILTLTIRAGVLPVQAVWFTYAISLLPLIAVLRGTARLTGRGLVHGLIPAAMLGGSAVFSISYLVPFEIFEKAEYEVASDEPWVPVDVERIYYAQPRLIEDQLGNLRAGVPGRAELFAVLAAYYPHEAVFLREIEAVGTLIEERFGAAGRVVRLANSRDHPERYPLANVRNLDAALARIAEAMNPDEDVLLLFLTSHGSEEIVSAGYWELRTTDLDADTLAASLAASGIRHAVVIISACNSGSFIPQLEAPDRLIITASAAERNSFGCSNENEWTYFGEAYFDRGLRATHDFRAAFDAAAALVAEWEHELGHVPSDPQIALGAGIEAVLEQLAGEAAGR